MAVEIAQTGVPRVPSAKTLAVASCLALMTGGFVLMGYQLTGFVMH